MDKVAQGVVTGFAFGITLPIMYEFNKGVLKTLFAVNVAIGKALIRLVLPPPLELDCDCPDCKNGD